MFDTIAKQLIPVCQIPAASIPGRGDKPIHPRTLGTWCLGGVRGIRLESLKVQGKRYTTIEAWDRFFRAVTKAAATTNRGRPPLVVGSRPSRQQARDRESCSRPSLLVPGSDVVSG